MHPCTVSKVLPSIHIYFIFPIITRQINDNYNTGTMFVKCGDTGQEISMPMVLDGPLSPNSASRERNASGDTSSNSGGTATLLCYMNVTLLLHIVNVHHLGADLSPQTPTALDKVCYYYINYANYYKYQLNNRIMCECRWRPWSVTSADDNSRTSPHSTDTCGCTALGSGTGSPT